MHFIGIDIGSTAAKVVVLGEKEMKFVLPTGWNSKDTAQGILRKLSVSGIDPNKPNTVVAATGYGRAVVEYADFAITEITCHGRGGAALADSDCSIIDVGGQDTKIINIKNNAVIQFLMNDKCSAGTGKFVEIMANRLGTGIDELFDLATKGTVIPISSLCTVFAETEIISYIGEGRAREDIAAGIIDSVAGKVYQLCCRTELLTPVILTGGLSHSTYFANILSQKLGKSITPSPTGRYAGALGAALLAQERFHRK